MNINLVIDYLNKELGYSVSNDYYSHIKEWEDWWKGFNKDFHRHIEKYGKKTVRRELFSLRMGKKVSEDWASLLVNEKTRVAIDDLASSKFLQGEDGEDGEDGVFDKIGFWHQENALMEKAFYSGTGAAVLRMENMLVSGGYVVSDPDTRIAIEYLPAGCILPLTVRHGKVIDVAFVSEVLIKGTTFIYVETQILEKDGYRITNLFLLQDNEQLKRQDTPAGITESYSTNSSIPLFSLISPNIVKNIDGGAGLGISVYANAIDELKGVDLAYNNFCRDFKLGGKKVFYDQSLVQKDAYGNTITPDDIAQQLFLQVGDGDDLAKGGPLIKEYNPTLRVQENTDGIQAALDYLSLKVGFGPKYYQFNNGSIVTATQYTGDRQELIQNANKHIIAINRHLKEIIRAILWAGKTAMGEDVDPETKITVNFDDGYIKNKDAERETDRQDVRDHIQQPWEYRVKYYGETEEVAKAAVSGGVDINNPFGFKE